MTANLHDHGRRLVDLEVALTGLVRAFSEAGYADVVDHAVRKARVEGVRGAEDLLQGARVNAAYRRR